MNPSAILLAFVAAVLMTSVAWADNGDSSKDFCVRLSVSAEKSPARITLHWPALPGSGSFTVQRSLQDANAWVKLAELPASATSFADGNVTAAVAYEYKVTTTVPPPPDLDPNLTKLVVATGMHMPTAEELKTRTGTILCGIELPLRDQRGTVIVVVEANEAAPLAKELSRLQDDLAGDGWIVIRHDVKADEPPPSLRETIRKDWRADPNGVKAVFLIGHVPVVRSGDYAPDQGHMERRGAQPADVYYADMDGNYTDVLTTPTRVPRTLPENVNVPGDGRFDQSEIPGSIVLQLGRVDFANMPAFAPLTATDLLRQYLDKDHNFRHKAYSLQPRCLYCDNLGFKVGFAFATGIWRTCSPMFGPDKVVAQQQGWLKRLETEDYLWGGAFAGSERNHCGAIVSTKEMTTADPKVAFLLMMGSYFADWDVPDNIMRAMLGAKTYTLTCMWSGLPSLDLHAMALGETTGYAARWTQRPDAIPGPYAGCVHIQLLGDPTLRMHVVAPVTELQAAGGADVKLAWKPSADKDVLGYHVYRAASPGGPYTRMTKSPVTDTTYHDVTPAGGNATYMVRAVTLQTSASGSYFNASQGAFVAASSAK